MLAASRWILANARLVFGTLRSAVAAARALRLGLDAERDDARVCSVKEDGLRVRLLCECLMTEAVDAVVLLGMQDSEASSRSFQGPVCK